MADKDMRQRIKEVAVEYFNTFFIISVRFLSEEADGALDEDKWHHRLLHEVRVRSELPE